MTRTQVGAAVRLLRARATADRETENADPPSGAALRSVEQTRPARSVAAKVAAAGGADAETALLLHELAKRHLGGHPALWCALHDALVGHRGGLPDLLAALVPQAPPARPAADGPLRPPAPRSVHLTLGLLLEHAEPQHAAAALAALPERVTTELLAGGTLPPPALVDAVVDHGDTRTRAALARHPRLDTRVLARLAGAGDPHVTAAVYRNPRTTQSLRRTIAERFDTVPLDDTLRAELTAPHGEVPRTWLTPLLGCGDPRLVVPALRWGVRQVAQEYALLRIWERTGPEAVRALLAAPTADTGLSRAAVDTVTEALAAPDGDGPRRLRERGEPYEDPARLPALLATARGTSTLRDLLSEPYAHDLDALAAVHAETPFMPKACEELARHEAATDAQRHAFRLGVLNEPWRAGGRRAGNTTPPARRLAEETLDESAADWAEGMAVAGLLDPVDLIVTARPAAHALTALARLAERDLLGSPAAAALLARTTTHLGERDQAWAALDTLLPEHPGTLADVIAEAGRTETRTASVPPSRRADEPAPPAEAHPTRRTLHRRDHEHAVAALDVLYSLAPDGAPRPDDPDVLLALSAYEPTVTPGLAELRAHPPETHGSSAQHTERAYVQGVLSAEELLALLPARRLLLLPHDWRRLAFAAAWRNALARTLRAELGTDPHAWLRLATTVTASEAASEGLTWTELLERARSGAAPTAPGAAVIGRPRPATPDEAIGLLERGDHLWGWPEGTLLCLADPDVVDAVLPRLGPDGPWLLAAYLLRHDRTPRTALDRLLADRDRAALRVLAAQSRWMERSGAVERLVDLDDAEVDLALLRHGTPRPHVHRIVTRSRPTRQASSLGARVLAEWRTEGSGRPAGGLMWLCSAEPDLIEELLDREGPKLGLGHQLLGCLRLYEHGGADRLARLAGRDALGRSATTVCAKALASADPAGVLRARLDRELAPEKLVRKLRRARHAPHARDLVESLPPGEPVDWAALEAAHAEEPLPHWQDLVRLDGTPEDVRVRHAALLPEPGPDGLRGSARLTRERARHGLGDHFPCAPTTQLDGLLTAGLLDATDLLHLAAPAARLLAYLGAAARRTDAPPQAAEARAALAELVRSGPGTDPTAWRRIAERLTGLDPAWDPVSTVEALLAD
ncbi:hypothetical protein [Streptomyces sp. NRRL F-5727]|uniref:hypothetical protein n=1 Tax=Streptomyces sp. NRRL F-5727 TaxID=1463871 RepID=UPI00131D0ED2|nr:hypothetical protein [Streptomyces sp. NRRL F-5727]